MTYSRWWHSLAISFSVATWGLAQPLYGVLTGNTLFGAGMGVAIILVMLIFHALPTAILFLLDRAAIQMWGAGKVLRSYRTILFAGAILVFLVQVEQRSLPQMAFELKALLIIGVIGAIAALVLYGYRPVTMGFSYLSVASLILTGAFVFQSGLLGGAWSQPVEPLSSPNTSADKDPVFILIFDGLGRDVLMKDGQIDPDRFPHLAALGRDSAVFTNATTNYFMSRLVTTSFFTGRWVSLDKREIPGLPCRQVSDSCPDSLFSVLSEEGYAVSIYDDFGCTGESLTCEPKAFLLKKHPQLLVREVAALIPAIIPDSAVGLLRRPPLSRIFPIPWMSYLHAFSVELWDEFVAGITISTAPGRVSHVHLMLPHQPYDFDIDGRRREAFAASQDPVQTAQLYADQVMFVDRLVGQFTAKLKAEGLYDRAFIIITGDHGPRALGGLLSDPPRWGDEWKQAPRELHGMVPAVPLIIHGPGVAPQVSQVDYQHIDFKPTLLDILNMPPEGDLVGISAFASQRPTRPKAFHIILGRDEGEEVLYIQDKTNGRWLLGEFQASPIFLKRPSP